MTLFLLTNDPTLQINQDALKAAVTAVAHGGAGGAQGTPGAGGDHGSRGRQFVKINEGSGSQGGQGAARDAGQPGVTTEPSVVVWSYTEFLSRLAQNQINSMMKTQ